jgi:hypothetical protein
MDGFSALASECHGWHVYLLRDPRMGVIFEWERSRAIAPSITRLVRSRR